MAIEIEDIEAATNVRLPADARMRDSTEARRRVDILIERLDRRTLAVLWHFRAPSYLATYLHKSRVVQVGDLDALEDALEAGRITQGEFDAVTRLDVLVLGQDKREADRPPAVAAVEVSVTIASSDVTRAADRAEVLRKAGYRALPVVGGVLIGEAATREARERGVAVELVEADAS